MNISRESIFISALRSFCNAFAALIGIIIGLILLGILFANLAKPSIGTEKTAMAVVADAEGNRKLLPASAPVILRINIHDVIGSRKLNQQSILTELLNSREDSLQNNRVKGILLHINSPGGLVFDSNNIYMALEEYKEKYKVPIYAYVDGLCASGAMYIACSADKIFSNPSGVIGSVGVLMGPNFNFSTLMEKIGISQITLTEGKDKDMLSPFRPWKPDEDASLKALIAYDYKRFIDIVLKARPQMDKNKLINDYGAQVFDPIKAQEYGYIDDGNATYSKALSGLVKAANIDGEYQVVELKVIRPLLSDLVDDKSPLLSGKIKHEFEIIPELRNEWINKPLYLYSPLLQRLSLSEQ